MKAFVDTSKGIPNDCSMTFNLMLQIAPLLAALECPMKILKLLEPLIDVIKAVPSLNPIKIGEAMPKFIDAAADLAPCFAAFANIPIMVMDLLRLIRAVLNCLLGQLRSIRNLMNGLSLRLGEAEGRPELRAQIECAQKNAAASAQMLTSSIDPIAGVMSLMKTLMGLAGIDLDLNLTPAAPRRSPPRTWTRSSLSSTPPCRPSTRSWVSEMTTTSPDGRSFLGTGVRFPMTIGPDGGFGTSGGERLVTESIWLVLSTAPGERVMNPRFGCAVHQLVLAPVTDATYATVAHHAGGAAHLGAAHRRPRRPRHHRGRAVERAARRHRLPPQGQQRPQQRGLPVLHR